MRTSAIIVTTRRGQLVELAKMYKHLGYHTKAQEAIKLARKA